MSDYGVIGIDPGGTTGLFTVTVNENGYATTPAQIGPTEHHLELYNIIENTSAQFDDTYIVCESFLYRNDSRPGLVLISREYIGVAKLACERFRGCHYVEQSPAQAKGFVDNNRLKKLGFYTPNMRHAMDAARHATYFLVNNKEAPQDMRIPLLQKGWK